ncbi:hypothetical protein Q7P35_008223 [Cladosporium inversicolor]
MWPYETRYPSVQATEGKFTLRLGRERKRPRRREAVSSDNRTASVRKHADSRVTSKATRSKPRKKHAKSFHGCSNCRRRHIKCDEAYPQCPDSGSDASGRRRLDDSDFVRYRTSEGSESRESTASCNSSAPAMNAVALDTGTAGISGQDLFSTLRYTKPQAPSHPPAIKVSGVDGQPDKIVTTDEEKEDISMAQAFPSQAVVVGNISFPSPAAEVSVREVREALFAQSVKKAPGVDGIGFKALRLLWRWAEDRIVSLVQGCTRTGYHPCTWKTAKGILLRK